MGIINAMGSKFGTTAREQLTYYDFYKWLIEHGILRGKEMTALFEAINYDTQIFERRKKKILWI